jgi:very-short-patch-repair endonuclease
MKKIFIERAKATHGDKYNYDKTIFKTFSKKVNIECPVHGTFYKRAAHHIDGQGCPKCSKLNRIKKVTKTKDHFLKKANTKHNNKYKYDLTNYINTYSYINISCPIHGVFKQKANDHLQGQGCKLCAIENRKMLISDFIKKANLIHSNKYKYNIKTYNGTKNLIEIECGIHGIFKQLPANHLQGQGCPKCYNDSKMLTTNDFIKKAKSIHGDKYDYTNVKYEGSNNYLNIKCRTHGYFKQRANTHLNGHGCPICNESKGESKISSYLDKNNIKYIREYKINGYKYRYDFYLPDLNILIEYDGMQHFKPVEAWGGKKHLKDTIERDSIKTNLAVELNINLIRIPYTKYKDLDYFLDNKIDSIYKYKINGEYYKTFLEMAKKLKLPDDASPSNFKKYL